MAVRNQKLFTTDPSDFQSGIVSAALLSAVYVWNDYLVSGLAFHSKREEK